MLYQNIPPQKLENCCALTAAAKLFIVRGGMNPRASPGNAMINLFFSKFKKTTLTRFLFLSVNLRKEKKVINFEDFVGT